MKVCDVDGCAGEHCARGLCEMHYRRLRKRGSVLPVAMRTCDLEGCERKHFGRGFCQLHHNRLRATGDVGADRPVFVPQRTCSVDGCERDHLTHGWCHAHYQRWKATGDVDAETPVRLPGSGENVEYDAVHGRLRRQRGKAAGHLCECGAPADQWAYDHSCPNERQHWRGPYSTDLSRYRPMCHSCHHTFDHARARERANAS